MTINDMAQDIKGQLIEEQKVEKFSIYIDESTITN